jgi:hypothetical protein
METKDFKDKIQILKEANDKIFNHNIDKTEIGNNLIFIYTQPKVGSTSLVSSLRLAAADKFNIIHLHDETTLKILTGIENLTVNEIINYNASIGKNIYVIDVYRTPIERKMSVFFEEISSFHFNNSEENVNTYDIKKVIKRFNDIFHHLATTDNYMEKYNITIPETFDYNKKYIHQKINGINYIKLRLKDSQYWSSILSKIFEREIIMVYDYETNYKKIADLYRRFKENYKLPLNYYEDIKTCKFLNYYYSEQERNEYLNLWNTKTCENHVSFTKSEYDLYIKICLENQIYNFIQLEHYIDNGCLCNLCFNKRKELFTKAKSGIKIREKIIHNAVVNEFVDTVKTNITNRVSIYNEMKLKLIQESNNLNKNVIKRNSKLNNKISNKLNPNVMVNIIKNKK